MDGAQLTVAELNSFRRQAVEAGMSESEIDNLTMFLSINPAAGDEIAGTGGCRKLRVAGRGKGKSGGYRTITFYSGTQMPVFLLAVFSKGEKANLSKEDRNFLKDLTKQIVLAYQSRVVKARVKA